MSLANKEAKKKGGKRKETKEKEGEGRNKIHYLK
jgi:hypothetical protein